MPILYRYVLSFPHQLINHWDNTQKGKERRTGELAHKEEEKDDHENPFENSKEDAPPSSDQQKDDGTGTNSGAINNRDQAPISDEGARKQAATTEPEGTSRAQEQAGEGTQLQRDAQLNSVQPTSF